MRKKGKGIVMKQKSKHVTYRDSIIDMFTKVQTNMGVNEFAAWYSSKWKVGRKTVIEILKQHCGNDPRVSA